MIEIQTNLTWLGNALEAREPRMIFETGIRAIVDVAFEESPALLPRQLMYFRIPIIDGGGNDSFNLTQAVQVLVDLMRSGVAALVACSAGMSRSPILAAFAIGHFQKRDPVQIIQEIGELRALEVNGVLWRDVSNAVGGVR